MNPFRRRAPLLIVAYAVFLFWASAANAVIKILADVPGSGSTFTSAISGDGSDVESDDNHEGAIVFASDEDGTSYVSTKLSDSGFFTTMLQSRSSLSGVTPTGQLTVVFSPTVSVPYSASQTYSVPNGRYQLQTILTDRNEFDPSGIGAYLTKYLSSTDTSTAPNAMHSLEQGSAKGTLLAGHTYLYTTHTFITNNEPDAGATGSGTMSFNIKPPDVIYLAFGEDAPWNEVLITDAFDSQFTASLPGTMPAATGLNTDAIKDAVEDIFQQAGANVVVTTTRPAGPSKTLYFSSKIVAPTLYGANYESLPNRFDEDAQRSAVVFVDSLPGSTPSNTVSIIAQAAAHELGHEFGLRHVEPNPSEIMGNEFAALNGMSPVFNNQVSEITDKVPFLGGTHNPVYHLQRYVNGLSDQELKDEGILPGTWDQGLLERISEQVSFSSTSLTLYDAYIVSAESINDSTSSNSIAHFDQITLAQLSQYLFSIDQGEAFEFFASLTPGGQLNVTLSTGNPFGTDGTLIAAIDGSQTVYLQQSTGTGNDYLTLATGSAIGVATSVPEPPSIALFAIFCALSLRVSRFQQTIRFL